MPDQRGFPDDQALLPQPTAPIGLDRTRPDPGRGFPDDEPDPLRQLIGNAAQTTPDAAAKVFRLRLKTGLTPSVIERNLDQVEQATARADFDPVRFREANPHLSRWILDEPSRASLVQDDLESLSLLERVLQVGANTVRATASGIGPRFNVGAFGLAQFGAEAMGLSSWGEYFAKARKQAEGIAENVRGPQAGAGELEQAFYSGFESLGQTAVGLGMSVATGSPTPMLSLLGAQTGGEAYGQARDVGRGVVQAGTFGLSQAAVEVATETIPAKWLLGDLAKRSGFLATIARQGLAEVPGEQVATLLQDLNQWATINPEAPFSTYLAERPSAAAQTLVATLTMVGAQTSLATALDRLTGASASQRVIEDLHTATEAVKLRETAPEALQDFVAQAAASGLTHVYAPAAESAEYFQSKGENPAQVFAALTGGTEAFQLAMETGGDVAIPTAAYLTQIVGSGHEAFFTKELRLSPDSPNGRETQEQLKTEAEQPEPAEDVASRRRERTDIKDQIVSRLVASGRASQLEAETVATWVSEEFGTTAERAGLDLVALAERWLPQVQAGEPGVQAANELQQSAKDPAAATWSQVQIQAEWVRRNQTPEGGSFEGGVISDRGKALGAFADRTRRRGWVASTALAPLDRRGPAEAKRIAVNMASDLVDMGVLQRAWDKQGEVFYARVDATVPPNLTTNPTDEWFGVQPSLPGAESVREQNIQTPQIEAPFSLSGEASTATKGKQGTLFQSASPFYSRLIRAVEDSKQAKASGAQWKATIRNAKSGINQDEFALTRVEDLDDGRSYTKQEVLEYLAANQVQVQDVTLGAAFNSYEEFAQKMIAKYGEAYETEQLSPEERQTQTALWEQGQNNMPVGDRQTHFASYQLPGADEGSYREVFLTVPSVPTESLTAEEQELKALNARTWAAGTGWTAADNERARELQRRVGTSLVAKATRARWQDGHSAYSEIKNPLVRLRFNTRTTADGQRVLFLEEVQPPSPEQQKRMPPLFVKHWREIAFKWALRHAAEQGLDAVAWTTGEQQAARYDLSKQVDEVKAFRREPSPGEWPGGAFDFMVRRKGAQEPNRRGYEDITNVPVAKLEETVGKDLAAKIAEQPAGWQTYAGVDLEIGGEGLKKLYNVDFRNVVNSLPAVKRNGGKVGTVAIDRGLGLVDALPPDIAVAMNPGPEREAAIDAFFEAQRARPHDVSAQPALTITPELRDAVMAGQALFQGPRGSISGIGPGPISPLIKLFRAKNRSTLFHEFAHMFLAMYRDIAVQLRALDPATLTASQRQILTDMDTLEAWFTSTDPDQQQEQFARGHELFEMEGKAPSIALRGVFARARSWLLRIYEGVAKRGGFTTAQEGISHEAGFKVELTDEVRGVMARMMASDAAIAEAEQDSGVQALFVTAEQAQVPETEFEGYRALTQTAHDARVSQLQTRVMNDLLREDTEWWKMEKATVRAEVTAEVHAQPVYRALSAIRTGTKPDGTPLIEGDVTPPMKLSKAALIEQFGPEILARLPRPYVYTPGRGGPQAGPELRDRPAEQPVPETERSAEGVGDGPGAERRRLPAPGDYPLEAFSRAGQQADRARLTPAVTAELSRLADELRELPYVENSWSWLGPGEKKTGNAAGGEANIIEGTAGAPVYDDILAFSPLNKRPRKSIKALDGDTLADVAERAKVTPAALAAANGLSRRAKLTAGQKLMVPYADATAELASAAQGERGEVLAAIVQALETRLITSNLAEGALRVAERREAGDYRHISPPSLPLSGGETVSTDFTDTLSERHDEEYGDVSFDVDAIEAEGLSPDVVAGFFGFEDGPALVTAIIAAPPMNRTIVEQTDARMRERHGDMLTNPAAMAEQAQQAIAEDHRDTVIRAEVAMLRKLQAATAPVKAEAQARTREGARRLRTELPDAATLKRGAAEQIASMKLRDIRPDRFFAAAKRGSRLATQAAAKQQFDEAIQAKRTELINLALYREALAVRDAVDEARTDFAKMFGSDKTLAKRRAMDYVNAARAIAATYFWPERRLETAREALDLVKRDNPELWLTLDKDISAALAAGTDLQGLTGAQFEAMRSTVDALWTTALRSRQVLINGQLVDLHEAAAVLLARMDQVALPAPPRTRAQTRWLGWKAAFVIMEHWVSFVDANDPGGVFRKFLFTPAADAKGQYTTARADAVKRFFEALQPIKDTLSQAEIAAPELGYTFTNRAAFLHALLHTGNESNFRKLILGRKWGTLTDEGTVDSSRWDAFLTRMAEEGQYTKADIDFAQAVWNLTDSLKPGAQRSMVEQYGRRFKEVTAWPVVTPFGAYAGGYVPAVVDPFESADGSAKMNLDAIENVPASIFPEPGFTKSRMERYAEPLALDLALIPNHLDKVLRFTFLQPRAKEIQRLIREARVKERLYAYDPTLVSDVIDPWLQRFVSQKVYVSGKTKGGQAADTFFRALRSRSALTLMAGNITNSLQQFTGIAPLLLKVQPRYLRSALWGYVTHPTAMIEAQDEASAFMRTTGSGQVAEEQRVIDDLLLHPNKYQTLNAFGQAHGYFFQKAFQNVVSRIGWQGAQDQALERGMTPDDAVRFADSVVRETQGTGQPEDISSVQVQSPFIRLFIPFFGWANMMANLNGFQQAAIVRDMGLRKGAGRMLYTWFFGYMTVAVVSELIRQSLSGWDDDDDDTHIDEILWLFFGSQARLATTFVPGGTLQAASNYYFTGSTYDDRMMSSPAISQIESAVRLPSDVYKALLEDGPKRQAVRDTLSLLGLITGAPTGALMRPAGYLADVIDEREEPESAAEFVQGLVSGRSPQGR